MCSNRMKLTAELFLIVRAVFAEFYIPFIYIYGNLFQRVEEADGRNWKGIYTLHVATNIIAIVILEHIKKYLKILIDRFPI